MSYLEYQYMDDHGLESDRRKLEAYLRYSDSDHLKAACQSRIRAIMEEQNARASYNIGPAGEGHKKK